MNASSADSRVARWKWARWLVFIAVVFAAQAGFIFAFGQRKSVVPRAVADVPKLQFAGNNELLALDDPTLFALPNQNGFASSVWWQMPNVAPPSFRWTEPPRWLALANENLGAVFSQFMQTNVFAAFEMNITPPPELSELPPANAPAPAQNSTLQVTGDLAQRPMLNPISLPTIPYNDVIPPSRIQVLVNPAGEVISMVLLPPRNSEEGAADDNTADEQALEIARDARFAPGPRLTIGQMIFNWRTVPVPAASAPAASP